MTSLQVERYKKGTTRKKDLTDYNPTTQYIKVCRGKDNIRIQQKDPLPSPTVSVSILNRDFNISPSKK